MRIKMPQCEIDLFSFLKGTPTIAIIDFDDLRTIIMWADAGNVYVECATHTTANACRNDKYDNSLIDPIITDLNNLNTVIDYLSSNKDIQTKPLFYDNDEKRSQLISLMHKSLINT